MLQRLQTIFLLLAAIITSVYLYSPVLLLDGVIPVYIRAYEVKQFISGYFVFLVGIAAGIAIGANLLAVFLFKYPFAQKLFVLLAVLNMFFCFGFVYYKWATVDYTFDSVFYYGNITPFAVVLLDLLAIRGIIKDEEIVRNYDRLR